MFYLVCFYALLEFTSLSLLDFFIPSSKNGKILTYVNTGLEQFMEGIVQLLIPAGTVQIFSISVLPGLQPLINRYISSVPISTAFDG